MQKYENRREAGMVLAEALRGYHDQHDVIVLALPRGGVRLLMKWQSVCMFRSIFILSENSACQVIMNLLWVRLRKVT